MSKILMLLVAASSLAASLLTGTDALAQARIPIPSGVCSASQIPYAADANNLACASTLTVPSTAAIGSSLTVAGSTTLGSTGTAISGALQFTASLTPSAVSSARCAEQTFTVTGAQTNDVMSVNGPAQNTASVVHVRVSATNTVAMAFCNPAATSTTPASGTYTFFAVRF